MSTILLWWKFIWSHKRLQKAKAVLRKKNKSGSITLPHFKPHYKARVIKTIWYWHENSLLYQKNGTERPEIIPYICGQLIFDRGAKTTQCRKDSLFKKWCWKNWISHTEKWNWTPILYHSHNWLLNSKWTKDLNVRTETAELLEENIKKKLHDMVLTIIFLL